MGLIEGMVLLAIGVMFLYLGITLPLGIARNLREGERPRQALSARLEPLPLRRVLDRLQVDTRGYLYRQPLHQVETHLRICEGCSVKARCERCLRRDEGCNGMTFCPNHSALAGLRPS